MAKKGEENLQGEGKTAKKKKHRVLWVVIVLVLLLLVAPLIFTAVIYQSYFGHRADKEAPSILSEEDFPSLASTEVTFSSGKNTLTGHLYYEDGRAEKNKGMVIVCHGIWSDHRALLTEINYFVENGYIVFAYDNTGSGESEGSSVVGLVQSQLDLDAALTFLENEDSFHDIPKLLYGHSWGAYAVTSVLNYDHDVAAVAAMSPFNQSIDMLLETGRTMYGNAINLLKPYLLLYERIKFGKYAGYTALAGINSTDIPVLVFHSDDDETISLESSVYAKADEFTNPNAEAILIAGRGHMPFLSDEAIAYRAQYEEALADDEDAECDKSLFYELDPDVMQQVLDTFDAAVEASGWLDD